MKKTMVLMALVFAISSGVAFGQDFGFQLPTGPEFWDKLNLSEEQNTKIQAIREETKKNLGGGGEVLRGKMAELKEILTSDKPDKATALKKVDEINEIRLKTSKATVGALIDALNVLTPEQREQARKMIEEKRAEQGRGTGFRERLKEGAAGGQKGELRRYRGEGKGIGQQHRAKKDAKAEEDKESKEDKEDKDEDQK